MLNVTTGTEIRNLLAEIMDLLDIKVNGNNKKTANYFGKKGLNLHSRCRWGELLLEGSVNHCFALESYSLYRATLILSLWPEAVYSY